MTEVRRIDVKALTRVEGEGALRVRVRGDEIEIAALDIYEPPRFFEKLVVGREIREVPDIVARICGICPVSYQMAACHALERALGVAVTPEIRALRRLLQCGEWIQSHSLHVHLLHAPDFLGFESGFTMAAAHPRLVEDGLRLKAVGSRIMEVVGGRAVHPVNVAVGGFHRAPDAAAIRGLVPDLEWALGRSLALVAETAAFDFPDLARPAECVALAHPDEYPMNEGRIASSAGLDIDATDFETHFVERQVPHSTALHCHLQPGDRTYLVGPVARINLHRDRLPDVARRAADAVGLEQPVVNQHRSIVVRCIEIAAACAEALAIARAATADASPCRVSWTPREATGCHAVEAPRGLLWHRFRIGGEGLVTAASIVPPTSQNQARIEDDLRAILPAALDLGDAAATAACEKVIRSHDPCISCATHFLRLDVDRGRG
ncbi:MAG: Ni/Fe hydrogenase subunit alpha [Planctomycetaceae bacterium]